MEVSFDKYKLSACILRIDRGDYTIAGGVSVVERRAERTSKLILPVEIPNVAKATVAVAGAACISKCLGLKSAAA